MKTQLLGGLAISAMIAFAGAAHAQGARETAPSSPQTGQTPGLQKDQQDAPKGQGQPSGRAQERTGMEGDRSTTTKPGETTTKPGATTGTKPADTTAKPDTGTRPSATTGTKPGDSASKPGEKPAADTAKVDLKPEQQTQLKQRITTVNVRTVSESQLNVTNISVGVAIPRTVELVILPPEIVEIVPQFRGYRIIRVGARYLIVHPETYRVVYIVNI
ncbi:MAG: DUF1236 domain-containing protein [Beijerinckiaceae bacterium]|nr:DUF1236 domain-containing protein [Beijerinckiaceae bacterium]